MPFYRLKLQIRASKSRHRQREDGRDASLHFTSYKPYSGERIPEALEDKIMDVTLVHHTFSNTHGGSATFASDSPRAPDKAVGRCRSGTFVGSLGCTATRR